MLSRASCDVSRPTPCVLLRENVTKYPRVMYYTTEWRMTWIFLDEKDVIGTYYLTSQ